ncbi:hypothetical protein P7C70_g8369, partial [Phenoliferia sp. Uapishka_3]
MSIFSNPTPNSIVELMHSNERTLIKLAQALPDSQQSPSARRMEFVNALWSMTQVIFLSEACGRHPLDPADDIFGSPVAHGRFTLRNECLAAVNQACITVPGRFHIEHTMMEIVVTLKDDAHVLPDLVRLFERVTDDLKLVFRAGRVDLYPWGPRQKGGKSLRPTLWSLPFPFPFPLRDLT